MENSQPQEIREPAFTVRFNHRDLPLDEESAKKYAQIGLKFEKAMDKLVLPASIKGVGITDLAEQLEKDALDGLKEKYPDMSEDELNKLVGVYRQHGGRDAEKRDDFGEYFPEVDQNSLPREVTDISVKNGVSVTDAYLRYLYQKGQICRNYADTAIAQSAAVIGSMKTAESTRESGAVSAMLKGLKK